MNNLTPQQAVTQIANAAAKALPGFTEQDIEYYLEKLFANPEGEWFAPTNAGGTEMYTICSQLHNARLISSRRSPRWRNGSFTGERLEFLYKKDLNY